MKPIKLDLQELLVGETARLRYVKRFSTCATLHEESVAEHTFFTTFFCMLLADWVNSRKAGPPAGTDFVDFDVLLRGALIHDLEEARTGDLPRYFKHRDVDFNRIVDEAGRSEFEGMLSALGFDGAYLEGLVNDWENSKEGLEGRILCFADFLSVLAYVLGELRSANRTMLEHLESMQVYAQSFEAPEYDFLQPLPAEAVKIFEVAVARHGR